MTGQDDDASLDSFIDHDMDKGDTAPGSATKKTKGRAAFELSMGFTPQAAIQPGATPLGTLSQLFLI